MLGEWYLPPGECQVISTITEGTISLSQPESSSAPTRIFQTPLRQTASVDAPQPDHVPRSGVLRLEEARRLLLRQGTKRFHEPDAEAVAALEAIRDIDRLEAIGERILDPDVQDWDDLLRTPRDS